MQKIELNKLKSGSLWRWRYAIIFAAYSFVFLLIFIYVSKFLGKEINRSFGQPAPEIEGIATSLDLAGYQRLAAKLKLATSAPERAVATSTEIKTTSTEALPLFATTSTATSSVSQFAERPAANQKLKIFIANSTKKSGLASQLKNDLSQVVADFNTGNRPPPLKQTVIRHKASIPIDKLELITQIVSKNYAPITEASGSDANYDLEIIIGQK